MNKQRKLIYDKSEGRCWYCGETLGEKGWHSDHFHPIVRNGDNSCLYPKLDCIENMVPSCAPCNLMKSSYTIEFFRSMLYNFVGSLNKSSTQYKFTKRYRQVIETRHPIIFHFEKMGYEIPTIEVLMGIDERVSSLDWEESDIVDYGLTCFVDEYAITVYYKGNQGYEMILTRCCDWEREVFTLDSNRLSDACREAGVLYYGRDNDE